MKTFNEVYFHQNKFEAIKKTSSEFKDVVRFLFDELEKYIVSYINCFNDKRLKSLMKEKSDMVDFFIEKITAYSSVLLDKAIMVNND